MSSICATLWSGMPRFLPTLVFSCVAVCSWLLMTLPWFTGSVRWHCISNRACSGLLWTLRGFTWPISFNRVRFKCTIAFRIITRRWFPATLFKQLLYGVIPGANPHAVLGSNHAFLDANDYHTIRVTQRRQAVIRSCLHNTVSPT